MESKILYEDESLVVCLKPSGIVSEEKGMPALLHDQLGGEFFCVHRLDKDVGGVMVYARTKQAAAVLSAAIAERKMLKEYLAVAQGVPPEPQGSFRDLIFHDQARNKSYVVKRQRQGVKEALLDYEMLGVSEKEGQKLSALKIMLHTGRSHQIRIQFASRGMPLAGDGRYGSALRSCPLALWSGKLAFSNPADSRPIIFSASPPEIFPWTDFKFT